MKYYFNLATGEVEFGKESRGLSRMGPYETLEEARNALAAAQERSESWDDDDQAWREEWSGSPE